MANIAFIGIGYLIGPKLAKKLINNEQTEDYVCSLNYQDQSEMSFCGKVFASAFPGEATLLSTDMPDFAKLQTRIQKELSPYIPDELGMPQLYLLDPWLEEFNI